MQLTYIKLCKNIKIYKSSKNATEVDLNIKENIALLYNEISNWENLNIYKSPINGIISTNNTDKIIYANDYILTIIPHKKGNIVGVFYIPIEKCIGVHKNQKIIVESFKYPKNDFGTITSNISEFSDTPIKINNDLYFIGKVNFGTKLITSRKYIIPEFFPLYANADIILKEYNILQRLFPTQNRHK